MEHLCQRLPSVDADPDIIVLAEFTVEIVTDLVIVLGNDNLHLMVGRLFDDRQLFLFRGLCLYRHQFCGDDFLIQNHLFRFQVGVS